ncbi:MAG: 50S ribosomal protein L17 [Desulfobacterales bacterium]|nr:50S ribosomal protein L17 [Desulfobacterales bacterium]
MRHRKNGLKLNRTSSHRNAMFKNMVTSLFKYDRIHTTDAKAKELKRWADRIITLAKRGDLHALRQALSIVKEKDVVYKLFDEATERFGKLSGGYSRVIKVGRRAGDAASMSLIELVASSEKIKAKTKKKAKSAKEQKSPAEVKYKNEVQEKDTAENITEKNMLDS